MAIRQQFHESCCLSYEKNMAASSIIVIHLRFLFIHGVPFSRPSVIETEASQVSGGGDG
jgi:hypothetical protein